jgi:oxygen-independent coproporphyrinogen-3 oxidase
MDANTVFDADLIRRYDCSGPRYTSYPTAVQFRAPFDVQTYRAAALLSNAGTTPLSLYVHVPFCASPCFYCGCNRVITRSPIKAERYVAALCNEIELQARLFTGHRPVEQLHFGGGTPTFLSIAQLKRIMDLLRQEFTLATDEQREYSIEIDPRTVDEAMIDALAELGFNRMSLGIQDFDPAVQAAVNRIQSVEQTMAVVERARLRGIQKIGFDLIYGLPRQTLQGFAHTLEHAVRARPTRVAVYGYAHLPQMFKAQRHIDAEGLPSPAQRLALLELTISKLNDAGYVYIGMDHFALPDDGLVRALRDGHLHRNFQGYSSHADCDLVGLGVSAIGKVGDVYVQNAKELPDYYASVGNHQLAVRKGLKLNRDDRVRRDVIQQLMCNGQVDFAQIAQDHCIEFETYFAPELERLEDMSADGLVEVTSRDLHVTARGRLLMRNIAMTFDAYLQPQRTAAFSKVI